MRIGPGAAGSSTSWRLSVSKSRIDPPERLAALQRGEHRPQLRTAFAAGEREAQRAQVAADRLQLAQDLARACRVEPFRGGGAQLAEAFKREALGGEPYRRPDEDRVGELAR